MTQAEPSTTDEHPLIGQTIANKYKIVRLLGEGGMGCVYLGEQMLGATTRKVAVKTLHKHLSHDASIKKRFEREVGTVAALEHPNTIQVFDYGAMDDGTLYIVMEFVQGKSVAEILEKEGAMPAPRVENIMKQVCGSLEEAHGHGIVHRDLKPDNVVLCERAGVKDWVEVLDFGIAKRSTEHDPNEAKLTQQGMVLGTPPYMSPEQFTGQPVDVRSDIYALGVMAYEMLSGKLPWEANTAWEWASKHMTEPPFPIERQPLGAHVPENMRNAIQRSLAKNKEERFASVTEFYNAFASGAGAGAGAAASHPGGHAGGTAMLNNNNMPHSGPDPQMSTGPVSAAGGGPSFSTGPTPARAGAMKTEMGAPMGGPPSSDFGGGMGMGMAGGAASAPMGGAPAAVVPAGPMVTGSSKKDGPPTLVFALGGLALLLFIGAGVAIAMHGKSKVTTTTSLDLGSATASGTTTMDSAVPVDTGGVTSAAPLDTKGTTPVVVNNGGTKPATKPIPTPIPSGGKTTPPPPPTPTPAKPDPPICEKARQTRASGAPPAVVKALETQCRNAGGVP